MTLVAIHQPNFFPWLGFFDKLVRCDAFVLLDHVQFPKKGGTWINRVRVIVAGGPAYITVPVIRSHHGVLPINEIEINDQAPWRRKMLGTLRASYARAPGFDEAFPLVERLIENPSSRLAAYNEAAITELVERLGIEAEIFRSSELEPQGQATDLLVDLVRKVGGDAYLAGGGAGGYQEDEKFAAAGLELVEQAYEPPAYPQQTDEPAAGLSIIDALMSCGLAGTASLLASGS